MKEFSNYLGIGEKGGFVREGGGEGVGVTPSAEGWKIAVYHYIYIYIYIYPRLLSNQHEGEERHTNKRRRKTKKNYFFLGGGG